MVIYVYSFRKSVIDGSVPACCSNAAASILLKGFAELF